MGERLNDGAGHSRRRAHPADAAADAAGARKPTAPEPNTSELEALLAQALRRPGDRPDVVPDTDGDRGADSDGERRAVAAFRAARDAGAHQARTRRRDDWRPRARRHTARSLRATLSVLVAGLALGGVAFAAVGSSTDGVTGERGRQEPSATASGARSAAPSVSAPPTTPADRDRPQSAKDTEAHCRAYEEVQGRGRAMDSTAWQRLVTAAGGEDGVAAYCAARSGPKTDSTPNAGNTAKAGQTPGAGKTPNAGNTPGVGNTAKAEKTAKVAPRATKGQ